jgi:ATP-binding cassette subfamily B protein
VFQDVFLFKQRVLDNILIGNKSAIREEAVAMAKTAQCHEFIEVLPYGYDMVIGTKNPSVRWGTPAPRHLTSTILKNASIIVLD